MVKSKKLESRDRLILTLMADDMKKAKKQVELLSKEVKLFEVGLSTYTALGPDVIKMVHDHGGGVYLDLKYHDIPSTVGKAVGVATKIGVEMITLHGAGGTEMLRRAIEAAQDAAPSEKKRPKILAITVLTSMESLGDIGVQFEVRDQVVRLAKMAKQSGVDGVVLSPLEIKPVRVACGNKFQIIATGVRPAGSAALDQRRIASPAMAVAAGADYIVIGRPVIDAKKPLQVIQQILDEMDAVV